MSGDGAHGSLPIEGQEHSRRLSIACARGNSAGGMRIVRLLASRYYRNRGALPLSLNVRNRIGRSTVENDRALPHVKKPGRRPSSAQGFSFAGKGWRSCLYQSPTVSVLSSFSWSRTSTSSDATSPTICGKRALPLSRPRAAKKPSLCVSRTYLSTLCSPTSISSVPPAAGMWLNVFERIARTSQCFILPGNRLIVDVAFQAVLFSPSHICMTLS